MNETTVHLAVHCRHLTRSVEPGRVEQFFCTCLHPVREGQACVGPFLEDLSTGCGLWEAHPQSHLIPLPHPEPWQRRRQRRELGLQSALRDWS